MRVKEKLAAQSKYEQWPKVIDGQAVGKLAMDPEVQYLVIPVKNRSGRKLSARLPNENNMEEKINAFLASVGLKNTFATIVSQPSPKQADGEEKAEFDIFDGFDEYRADNARRKENLRASVFADAQWLDAAQLSDLVGFENKNRSAGPNTWKRRNKIFAITHKGKNLYPRYCLDEAYQPLPVVKDILDIFNGSKSGWSLALWFGTGNSWLGGAKPKDRLYGDKNALIKAAQAASEGPQHG